MGRKDHMLHESLHAKTPRTVSAKHTDSALPIMLKMLVITVYALCVLWFFFDGRDWETVADMEWTPDATIAAVLGGVLWVVLAVYFVRGLMRSDDRLSYLKSHLGILMLLASVVFTYFIWLPALALALIVVGFILELPHHSSGHELTTALALIVFVSAIVTIGLVRVESAAEESKLSTISNGLSWTVARLLEAEYVPFGAEIDDILEVQPVTPDGRDLSAVLAVCAVLFAALIVGAVVSWLTRSSGEEESVDREAIDALTAEVAGLRETVERMAASLEAGRADKPPPQP